MDGRQDDLAYLINQSLALAPCAHFACFTSLNLLNLPNPPGSSLNHEGDNKSCYAVSLLSHAHLLIDPNTQARSTGHRTW